MNTLHVLFKYHPQRGGTMVRLGRKAMRELRAHPPPGSWVCACGEVFFSESSLKQHQSKMGCDDERYQEDMEATRAQRAAEAAQAVEDKKRKVRGGTFKEKMTYETVMQLSIMRYFKLTPATHVDSFKEFIGSSLKKGTAHFKEEVAKVLNLDDVQLGRVSELLATCFGWLDGIETETRENNYLKDQANVPVLAPQERVVGIQNSRDAEVRCESRTSPMPPPTPHRTHPYFQRGVRPQRSTGSA